MTLTTQGADVRVSACPLEGDTRPHIDPRELRFHPFSLERFPPKAEDDDDGLLASIIATDIQRSVIVTGDGCASPPNTVLGGSRRVRAALKAGIAIPYERRHGLTTPAQEEVVVLTDNAADLHGRKYLESQRAELERELGARLTGRVGRPKNPVNSDGVSGGDRPRGDARELIAEQTGASASEVGERQAIFRNPIPVVPQAAKDIVDANPKRRNRIATIVRKVSEQPKVQAALERARQQKLTLEQIGDLSEIRAAREQVVIALGLMARKPKANNTTVVEVPLMATRTPSQVVFDAGSYGVEIVERSLARFTRRGPKPKDDGVFIWPVEPWTVAVTSWNWPHVVRHVVDEFPDADRNRVHVGDVERIETRACGTCQNTWFWSDGRCADCHPNEPTGLTRSHEHAVRRLVATVDAIVPENARRELRISEWASGIEAGLTARANILELRSPVLVVGDDGFMPLDGGPFATVAQLSERVSRALMSMLSAPHHASKGADHA